MRTIEQPGFAWTASLLLAAVLIAGGCGGGGGSTAPTDAFVLGKVVSVDGQTSDLAGVDVGTSDGTTKATTDPTGTFQLSVRSGERIRLRFEDPDAPSGTHHDVGESDDDTPDGSDIDGDELEIDSLEDGETCEIEVEIEDGQVVEAWVNREHEDGEHVFEAQARLVPPENAPNQDAVGEVEVRCDESCCSAEIEVEGLTGPDVVEIVLWHPDGDEVSLGVIEVNAEGAGHWSAEVCWQTGDTGESGDSPEGGSGTEGGAGSRKGDGEVPFGEETLGDLKGIQLLLIDGLGNVVLVGEMPGSGAQHDDEDHCHAANELVPPEGSELEAEGVVLLKHMEDCEVLVIEVGGFDAAMVLDVVLGGAEGGEAVLGQLEVGEKGMGRFAMEACPGDELPFGAESLTALGGSPVRLVSDAGVVLQGELPVLHDGDCDDGHDEEPVDWRVADGSLVAPETSPEPDAEGWILVKQKPEACVLVIEVGGIAQVAVLTVVIVPPEGEAAVLGSFEIGLEGGGRYAQDGCDELPFEATSLDDLAGYGVELRDGEGHVVLAGEIPTLPTAE